MGMYMAQALGRGVVVGSRAGMGERLAWAAEAGLEAGMLGEGALGGCSGGGGGRSSGGGGAGGGGDGGGLHTSGLSRLHSPPCA